MGSLLACDSRTAVLPAPFIVNINGFSSSVAMFLAFVRPDLQRLQALRAERSSREIDFGVGRMLNGTGSVEP